ncbi:MAG: DeoR/GlpR transcriptional regulator [Kiritimatiellae bacterium]|nr:DeoR/GlpR transcriptional regulator [Kiritimatiellia bacterium]
MKTGYPKDLAPERSEKMRRILKQHRIVRVEQFCRDLAVSPATVRRDLARLEANGELRRVHGGAVLVQSRLDEPLFEDKAHMAPDEKRRIARGALAYIKPSDTIYLDGGSTVLELARLLHDLPTLTVTTNSLRVAVELAGGGPRVILVGGELRRLSQTFVGALTECTLERLHVDTAFMGTVGLCAEHGMTTTDPRESFTKSLSMAHAGQVVLLADSSKMGKVSFARFGDLSNVHVWITDRGARRKELAALRKKGLKVVLV